MAITFGSDPELFLCDESYAPVAACGLIGGTKEKPLDVEGYGLQEDNVMAEFTTPPTQNAAHVVYYAHDGVQKLLRFVRTKTKRNLGVLPTPTVIFPEAALLAAGQQALQFGCSPDYSAYTMGQKNPGVNPDSLRVKGGALRFAGGHVHVGYKSDIDLPEHVAVMFLDLTVGLSLVWSGEKQGERRNLYGQAGRYRPTSYGVEYRTPSNLWVYDAQAQNAISNGLSSFRNLCSMAQPDILRLYNEVPWHDVRNMIDSENPEATNDLGTWLNDSYPTLGLAYGG